MKIDVQPWSRNTVAALRGTQVCIHRDKNRCSALESEHRGCSPEHLPFNTSGPLAHANQLSLGTGKSTEALCFGEQVTFHVSLGNQAVWHPHFSVRGASGTRVKSP